MASGTERKYAIGQCHPPLQPNDANFWSASSSLPQNEAQKVNVWNGCGYATIIGEERVENLAKCPSPPNGINSGHCQPMLGNIFFASPIHFIPPPDLGTSGSGIRNLAFPM